MIYRADVPYLLEHGATKMAVLRCNTRGVYFGSVCFVYFLNDANREVAHYCPDMREFTGLVPGMFRQWGTDILGAYEVTDIRAQLAAQS